MKTSSMFKKAILLFCLLVGLGVAFFYTFLLSIEYQATATLFIRFPPPTQADLDNNVYIDPHCFPSKKEFAEINERAIAALKSPQVAKMVFDRMNLTQRGQLLPTGKFEVNEYPDRILEILTDDHRRYIEVVEGSPSKGPPLVNVSFRASDPLLVAPLANYFAEEYIQNDIDEQIHETLIARKKIMEKAELSSNKREEFESEIQKLTNIIQNTLECAKILERAKDYSEVSKPYARNLCVGLLLGLLAGFGILSLRYFTGQPAAR